MFYDRRPETVSKSPEKKIQIPTDDPSSVSLRKCTTLSVPSTSTKRIRTFYYKKHIRDIP